MSVRMTIKHSSQVVRVKPENDTGVESVRLATWTNLDSQFGGDCMLMVWENAKTIATSHKNRWFDGAVSTPPGNNKVRINTMRLDFNPQSADTHDKQDD